MTNIGFTPRKVIAPQVCRLEVLEADKAELYGLQIGLRLKVVGGEHDGHAFTDYSDRDEHTGNIMQGGKAWSIFEACLGANFHRRPGVDLTNLVGKQFIAQVTQTKTGSRNKVEYGTVGPVPAEGKPAEGKSRALRPGGGSDEGVADRRVF